MNKALVLAISLVIGLLASTSPGVIVVDGNIDPTETYESYLQDTANEKDGSGNPLYEPGLGIDRLYYANESNSYYLGLTVVGGTFDKDGSATSLMRMTGVGIVFFDDETSPLPKIIVSMAFNDMGFDPTLSFIREWNGAGYTETDFDDLGIPAKWDVAPSGAASTAAMEVRLAEDIFKVFTDPDSFPS
ncbi:MAG TPA: hypothetical protein VM098_08205, partial [Phycisphaerae bacterium]|nr:hypothetical protein [Phycisphaerae bacterium]